MKKLLLLFSAMALALTLAACGNDPEDVLSCIDDPSQDHCTVDDVCPEGQELVGTECLEVCPTGEHREGTECVVDTVTCQEGYHEEAGQCVEDDNRTAEEIAIDFFIDNFDGDMTFLSTALVNMQFENAMTMTTEFNFEITEDINEVHYIEAVIVDSFVSNETNGDMMKRDVYLDVDNELVIEFQVIMHELPNMAGVHVYIETAPLISLVTEGDPTKIQTLNWIGLEGQWAVLELDDSLQNVVELQVLKDMVVGLFFSEMGENFFDEVQENMVEPQLGFDLNQYEVDLGMFVDYIIEENWTQVEIEFNEIMFEHIALHADAIYVAPYLREFLVDYETALGAAGFNLTLLEKLEISTWNETTEMYEPNPPADTNVILPVDPLEMTGTIAFFEAMTTADEEAFIELVIKPNVEQMMYHQLSKEVNPDWLENDLISILTSNEQFLIDNWPEASPAFVLLDETNAVSATGPVIYWQNLTQDEKDVIHWAVDMENNGWIYWFFEDMEENHWEYHHFLMRHDHYVDIDYLEGQLVNLINQSGTYIPDNHMLDITNWVTEIETMGVYKWYAHQAPWEVRQAIVDAAAQVGFEWAIDPINELEMIADNNWDYSYNAEFWGEQIHIEGFTWELRDLLQNHQTYLEDMYNVDVNQLIADIEMYGGFEWYMTMSTEFEREFLMEISEFHEEWDHYRWVVEKLEEMYHNQDQVHMWFGRMRMMHDLEEMEWQGKEFINEIAQWLMDNTSIDPGTWKTEIMDMGPIGWAEQLDATELQALQDALDAHHDSWNNWPMWTLIHYLESPEEYDVCFGHWNWCHPEEELADALILLVQNHSQYLLDEYGVTAQNIVDDINANGVLYYYFDMTSEEDREMFRELAKMEDWPYEVMWRLNDISKMEEEMIDFLTLHQAELDTLDTDYGTNAIAYLETNGIQDFVANYVTESDMEILAEAYVYPELEALRTAIETDELEEFAMEFIFGNIHFDLFLEFFPPSEDPNVVIPNPLFDEAIIAQNMMSIDFDVLYVELETFDFEALAKAIYDGGAAYNTYVLGLTEVEIPKFLAVFGPGVTSAEMYMGFIHDAEYALDHLDLFNMITIDPASPFFGFASSEDSIFGQFVDMEYYIDNGIMDVVPSRTEDAELLLTMEIDGIGYAEIFDDLKDQVAVFMSGMNMVPFPYDENWDCVDLSDIYCSSPNFTDIIAELTTLESMFMYILHDPNDLNWMEMGVDLTDFAHYLVSETYLDRSSDPDYTPSEYNDDWTGVNELTLTITMENSATITPPTDPDNLNDIADDLGKFAMTNEAYQILEDYAWMLGDHTMLDAEMLNTEIYLKDIENMDFSMAFDHNMSYIKIVVPEVMGVPNFTEIDFEIVLYWADGTLVFDEAVGMSEIAQLWFEGELISETAYNIMVAEVDETNWHLSKLFLYYMWQDNNDNYKDNGMY